MKRLFDWLGGIRVQGLGQVGQDVTVARSGLAPTRERLASELGEPRYKIRPLAKEVALVLVDDLFDRAVLARLERVGPRAAREVVTPAYIFGPRWRPM